MSVSSFVSKCQCMFSTRVRMREMLHNSIVGLLHWLCAVIKKKLCKWNIGMFHIMCIGHISILVFISIQLQFKSHFTRTACIYARFAHRIESQTHTHTGNRLTTTTAPSQHRDHHYQHRATESLLLNAKQKGFERVVSYFKVMCTRLQWLNELYWLFRQTKKKHTQKYAPPQIYSVSSMRLRFSLSLFLRYVKMV